MPVTFNFFDTQGTTREIPVGERTDLPTGFNHYIEVDENITVGNAAFRLAANGTGAINYSITEVLNGNGQNITSRILPDITSTSGTFAFTRPFDHEFGSNYRITVEATDSQGDKLTRTVYLRVNDVDEYARRELNWMTPTSPVMLSSLMSFPTGNHYIGVNFDGNFAVRIPPSAKIPYPIGRAMNIQSGETVYHYLDTHQYNAAEVHFTGTGTATGKLNWFGVNDIGNGFLGSTASIGNRLLVAGQDGDNVIDETDIDVTFVPPPHPTSGEVHERRQQEALNYVLGAGRDRVVTGAGDDIVDGGAEEDIIDLRQYKHDTDRIIYRVRDNNGVIVPTDGGDRILGFRPGLDEIVFDGVSDFLHRLGTAFRALLKIEDYPNPLPPDPLPSDYVAPTPRTGEQLYQITGVELHFLTTAATSAGRLTGSVLEILFDNAHTIRYDFFKTLLTNATNWVLNTANPLEITDITTLKDLLNGAFHRKAELEVFKTYLNNQHVVRFEVDDILPQDLPDGVAYYLPRGDAWRLPATGPLQMTWKVVFPGETLKNQVAPQVRADAEAAVLRNLQKIEAVANIKFTQQNLAASQSLRHVEFSFFDIPEPGVGGYSALARLYGDIAIDYTGGNIGDIRNLDLVLLHEIGHLLGLSHPFENGVHAETSQQPLEPAPNGGILKVNLDWPNNPGRGYQDFTLLTETVLSYYNPPTGGPIVTELTLADKAALEFLYGAPGTNFDGVEAAIARATAAQAAFVAPDQVGTAFAPPDIAATHARHESGGWYQYTDAAFTTKLTAGNATTAGVNNVTLGASLPTDGRIVSFGDAADTYLVGTDFGGTAPSTTNLTIRDVGIGLHDDPGARNIVQLKSGLKITGVDYDNEITDSLTLTFENGAKLELQSLDYYDFKLTEAATPVNATSFLATIGYDPSKNFKEHTVVTPYTVAPLADTEPVSGTALTLDVGGMGGRLFLRIKTGGDLPILEDYLTAILAGHTLTRDNDASDIMLNLPRFSDSYGRSHGRTFVVEVFEILSNASEPAPGASPIFSEIIRIADDAFPTMPEDTFNERTRDGNDNANILGAISSEDTNYNGGGGDDTYIITRYQRGDLMIADSGGMNVIQFDYGVTITDHSEDGSKATLRLSTGAEITINQPTAGFSYQLGADNVLTDPDGSGSMTAYDLFKTAINADAIVSGNDSTHYTVGALLPDPDPMSDPPADNTDGARIIDGQGPANDVLGAGNDRNLELNGGLGDDIYVITRHQYGDVVIRDGFGVNVIKFDYGVRITDHSEVEFFDTVFRTSITLSTGAVITINNPANNWSENGVFAFQFGDGEVMLDPDGQYVDGTTPNSMTAYSEFKTAINADAIDPMNDSTHYTVKPPTEPRMAPAGNGEGRESYILDPDDEFDQSIQPPDTGGFA